MFKNHKKNKIAVVSVAVPPLSPVRALAPELAGGPVVPAVAADGAGLLSPASAERKKARNNTKWSILEIISVLQEVLRLWGNSNFMKQSVVAVYELAFQNAKAKGCVPNRDSSTHFAQDIMPKLKKLFREAMDAVTMLRQQTPPLFYYTGEHPSGGREDTLNRPMGMTVGQAKEHNRGLMHHKIEDVMKEYAPAYELMADMDGGADSLVESICETGVWKPVLGGKRKDRNRTRWCRTSKLQWPLSR